MIISRNLRLSHVVVYTWKPMLYFTVLSCAVYVLHVSYSIPTLTIPFNAVATLSTALGIYLGFKMGEKIEDPFENRMFDTPLTSISVTIEENLKEMLGEAELPVKPKPIEGVVM